MRFAPIAAIVVALITTTNDARAEVLTQMMLAGKDSKIARAYARATFEGIAWANIRMEITASRRLFCLPPKMVVSDEQIFTFVETFLRDNPDRDHYEKQPFGLVLDLALEHNLPCGRG